MSSYQHGTRWGSRDAYRQKEQNKRRRIEKRRRARLRHAVARARMKGAAE